jgi:zinc protease
MLDYALFAESDRMGHLLGVLDQKKLDLQRGVVQNEKRQRENQPYGVVEQIVTETPGRRTTRIPGPRSVR